MPTSDAFVSVSQKLLHSHKQVLAHVLCWCEGVLSALPALYVNSRGNYFKHSGNSAGYQCLTVSPGGAISVQKIMKMVGSAENLMRTIEEHIRKQYSQ